MWLPDRRQLILLQDFKDHLELEKRMKQHVTCGISSPGCQMPCNSFIKKTSYPILRGEQEISFPPHPGAPRPPPEPVTESWLLTTLWSPARVFFNLVCHIHFIGVAWGQRISSGVSQPTAPSAGFIWKNETHSSPFFICGGGEAGGWGPMTVFLKLWNTLSSKQATLRCVAGFKEKL